ncbi:MAG: hypothetical protein ABIM89_16650 [Mycobacteriales bacterium]
MSPVSKPGLKNVSPGKLADVCVHNGYAYLAAWGGVTCCTTASTSWTFATASRRATPHQRTIGHTRRG